jgi:hypothetical protein
MGQIFQHENIFGLVLSQIERSEGMVEINVRIAVQGEDKRTRHQNGRFFFNQKVVHKGAETDFVLLIHDTELRETEEFGPMAYILNCVPFASGRKKHLTADPEPGAQIASK